MIAFIDKYLGIYSDFKRKGSKNKILLLMLLLVGLIYSYCVIEVKYYRYHWYNVMPHKTLVLIFIIGSIIWILIILTMNSILFINKSKLKTFEYNYKQDFINSLRIRVPEIKDYIHNQKIHPKVFINSRLFNKKYSDYLGDDWIRGEFNGVLFEVCELNVFRLFSNIFHGFFIVIKFPKFLSTDKFSYNTDLTNKFEQEFCTRIKSSLINGRIYIAINFKDNFLKCDKEIQIKNVQFDYELIYNTIQIIKEIIEKNKN